MKTAEIESTGLDEKGNSNTVAPATETESKFPDLEGKKYFLVYDNAMYKTRKHEGLAYRMGYGKDSALIVDQTISIQEMAPGTEYAIVTKAGWFVRGFDKNVEGTLYFSPRNKRYKSIRIAETEVVEVYPILHIFIRVNQN